MGVFTSMTGRGWQLQQEIPCYFLKEHWKSGVGVLDYDIIM